jgi:hypothetical protein
MPASGQIIISAINEFLSSPHNSLQTASGEKAWEEALIGFSSGGDPLYQQLKSDIGSFYWTPLEIFSLSFPEIPVQPEDLTVIRAIPLLRLFFPPSGDGGLQKNMVSLPTGPSVTPPLSPGWAPSVCVTA